MKKLLIFFLCLSILLLVFASCDSPISFDSVDISDATDIKTDDKDNEKTDKNKDDKETEEKKTTEKNEVLEETEDNKEEDNKEEDNKEEDNKEDDNKEDDNKEDDNKENVENKEEIAELPESSEGLWFNLNEDGKGYTLMSNSNCKSNMLVVGKYQGLPVTAISSSFRMYDYTSSITIGHSVTELHAENFVGRSEFMTNITVQEGNPVYQGTGNCLIETATRTMILGARSSVIPDDGSVTTIGENAFRNLNGLRSIVIPDTVTVIENNAFRFCDSLESVVLSKNLKSIGERAFNNTALLGDLIIPEGVTYVGKYAFSGANLSSITVPSTLENIEQGTFRSMPLKRVTLSPGIVTIGELVFAGCSDLEGIVIPEGVTTIKDSAFEQCYSLKNVSFPNSLTDVAPYTLLFSGCRELVLNEYKGAYYLGNDSNPYAYLVSGISRDNSYTEIHPETRIISTQAFGNFVGTDLFIPAKVHSIHSESFTRSQGITSISVDKNNSVYHSVSDCIIESATGTVVYGREVSIIPNSEDITVLGEKAFARCKTLSNIVIPNNIKEIRTGCFASCVALTDIQFEGTKAEWRAIAKADGWNKGCGEYVVKCTDGDIAKAEDN